MKKLLLLSVALIALTNDARAQAVVKPCTTLPGVIVDSCVPVSSTAPLPVTCIGGSCGGGGGTPGGSNTQVQINSAGTFAGTPSITVGTGSPYTVSFPNLAAASAGLMGIGTTGVSGAGSNVPMVSASGDVTIGTTGAVTVTGIRGTGIAGVTGTGNAVLASGATLSTATLNMGSILSDVIDSTSGVVATQVDKTSNTTFAALLPTAIPVAASGTYACHGYVSGTAGASGGAKFKIDTTDTASMTTFRASASNWNGTTINARATSTTFGGTIGAATAVFTDVFIDAAFNVNAAGTLQLYFAQNASDAATSSAYVNSYFSCRRTN